MTAAVAQAQAAGEPLLKIRGLDKHFGPVQALTFGHGGRLLASATADRAVQVWDVTSGAEVVTLEWHTEPVTAVDFGPGGVLASGDGSGVVRLWPPEVLRRP